MINKSILNMLRKLLASILVFLFVLLALPFAWFFSIFSTVTDENFYNDKLIDLVYERLITEIPAQIDLSTIDVINKYDLEALIRDSVTREDLKTILNDTYAQIKETPVQMDGTIDFNISTLRLKEIGERFNKNTTSLIMEQLPPCEEDPSEFLFYHTDLFECLPENASMVDYEKQVETSLDLYMLTDIPDEWKFSLNVPKGLEGNVDDLFCDTLRLLLLIYVLVFITILFIIGLLIYSPPIRILKWEAMTIFYAAFLILLTAFSISYLYEKLIGMNLSMLNVQIIKFVLDRVVSTIYSYFIPVAAITLICLVIGFVYDKEK